MLNAIYPPELLELFPDKDFDKSKVKEWFKATAKLGDSAANLKSRTLFLQAVTAVQVSSCPPVPA